LQIEAAFVEQDEGIEGRDRSTRAAEKDRQARQVITNLFRAYVANPSLLPDRYSARIDEGGLHRTVCDYIAGMTDRFAIQEHERLSIDD
jgi:dGTPase